jgi:hypothetical protein
MDPVLEMTPAQLMHLDDDELLVAAGRLTQFLEAGKEQVRQMEKLAWGEITRRAASHRLLDS